MVDFNPDNIAIPSTVPTYVASGIRTFLSFVGGYVVAKGYLTGQQVIEVAGFIIPAGVFVWSAIQKHNAAKALTSAIIAPAGKAS